MSKKRRYAFLFLVCVVGVVVVYNLATKEESVEYEPVFVERGSVIQSVSVSGHIEPVDRITLAFPMGGHVESVLYEEGATVEAGTVLSALRGGVLRAGIEEAQARVAREEAILRDLIAPLRDEERAVKDATVRNAEESIARADASARSAIARAFVYADDAIREKADELFSSTRGDPSLGVTFTYGTTEYFIQADSETEVYLNGRRKVIETTLEDMRVRAQDASIPIEDALRQTENDLIEIEDFLTELAQVANKYNFDDSVNQSVYESYQTSITSARTAINTARTDISTAYTTYTTASATLSLALRDLELSVAGASNEAILAQEALVGSAISGVETARERYAETKLSAPFSGIISRVYKVEGETVSPYEPVFEFMTEGAVEVESYIPEADIAKVKLGDKAEMTFDAFGRDKVFTAEVVYMARTETVRDGVPSYKTTLRLSGVEEAENNTFLPGMTADIEIWTDRRDDVLFLPVRSVLRDGERTYVRVYKDGVFSEKNITTGLRGSEGTIEVLFGLTEGEEVVLYVEEA